MPSDPSSGSLRLRCSCFSSHNFNHLSNSKVLVTGIRNRCVDPTLTCNSCKKAFFSLFCPPKYLWKTSRWLRSTWLRTSNVIWLTLRAHVRMGKPTLTYVMLFGYISQWQGFSFYVQKYYIRHALITRKGYFKLVFRTYFIKCVLSLNSSP